MSEHVAASPEKRVASDILGQAEAHLEQHGETIDLMQRYAVQLPNDYVLELRLTGSMGKEPARTDSRYIYLTDHSEKCGVDFSLELNSLLDDTSEIKGLTQNFYHIASAMDGITEDHASEKNLLGCMLRLMLHYDQTNTVDATHYSELEAAYIDLLDQGAASTTVYRGIKVSDEIYVGMRSRTLEGACDHAWPWHTEMPAFCLIVTQKSIDKQTVLELHDDGLMESFEQRANVLERKAAYAKPEDVMRDESGKIIGYSISGNPDAAIREAERAAGIRELEMTQLLFIQEHLSTALRITED